MKTHANPASAAPSHLSKSGLITPRIGVLHNPKSGTNLKSPAAMHGVFAAYPHIPYRIVSDPVSVTQALNELAALEVDTLVVSGGDGTMQATLSAILSSSSPFPSVPHLAVLRAGTTNMIAGDVGLPGRPDHALIRLIDQPVCGSGIETVQRHILRIDPGAGRAPIYGMFFGAAAIVQGVEYCKSKVHSMGLRGEIGPGIAMLRFVLAMACGERNIATPIPLRVSMDNAPSRTLDCSVVHVTTLERLFLGLRPFWGKENAPLHYCSVRAQPRHWLRSLPGLLRGRRSNFMLPSNGYISHNVDRLQLWFDSRFIVDGEIFSPEPHTPLELTDGGVVNFLQFR